MNDERSWWKICVVKYILMKDLRFEMMMICIDCTLWREFEWGIKFVIFLHYAILIDRTLCWVPPTFLPTLIATQTAMNAKTRPGQYVPYTYTYIFTNSNNSTVHAQAARNTIPFIHLRAKDKCPPPMQSALFCDASPHQPVNPFSGIDANKHYQLVFLRSVCVCVFYRSGARSPRLKKNYLSARTYV